MREFCYRLVPNGPQNFDGSEDDYDQISDILIIKDEGKVIGGARIVGRSSANSFFLPLEEKSFSLIDFFPDYRLESVGHCEFGRLAILPEYRSQKLLQDILFALSEHSIKRDYKYLFSMAPYKQARCYRLAFRALGFEHPYIIHNNIDLPTKSEDECGVLTMRLASLQFPEKLNSAKDIPVSPKIDKSAGKAAA